MASRFWVGGTGTWDSTTTTNWSATTGGAGGASAPTTGDSVTIDASSGAGTITASGTINGLSLASITCGAMGMTLDFSVNNPSLTLGSFFMQGTGVRTINLGSGTFTLTATSGTVLDAGTATNLTLNAGTSTISAIVNPSNLRTLALGGKTWATITFGNGTANPNAQVTVNGTGSVIGTFLPVAPVQINMNSAMTITNALTASGTSASNVITYLTTLNQFTITLTGGGTMQWVAIGNLTFTGSPTATNSFNLAGTSGITITGPSGGGGVVSPIGS